MVALTPPVAAMTNLTFLDLSMSGVVGEEELLLPEMLQNLHNLQHLDLSGLHNKRYCQSRVFCTFATALRDNRNGERARMHKARSGLARHLSKMTKLTYRNLEGLLLSSEGMDIVGPVVGGLSALQKLHLSRNQCIPNL